MTDPARRRRVEEVCDAALNREVGERAAFVAAACGDDDALRREVEALLAHAQRAEGFLAAPMGAVAAHVLGDERGTSLVGRQISSYRILSLLGVGGMGEVYRARDTKLGRDVAIKVLPASFANDPDRLARLAREARLLAALNHPHIATIHGLEEADGLRALVMELVEGPTLAEKLAQDSQRKANAGLPVAEALKIGGQIAEALEAAHEKGVIHRDLKPANIKLSHDGQVKMLDFGLAKAFSSDGSGSDVSHLPSITATELQTGALVGTPAYMSPEQARGQAIDKRTDIWAFGCVLYEMLTGQAAFACAGTLDTLAAVLGRDPDWALLPAGIDLRLRRLLRRCLEKDRSRRLRDIGDVGIELDDIREGSGQPAFAAQRSIGTRGRAAIAIAVAVAVGSVGGSIWVRRPQALAPEVRLDITAPLSRDLVSMAMSPDGLQVASTGDASPNSGLWVRELSAGTPRFLPATEGATLPFWSPDGQSLGFFADNRLKRIDVRGGAAQVLANAPNPQGGAWCPDGTILFAPTQLTPIMRVAATGGEATPVTRIEGKQLGHLFPHVLPDGTHFLYAVTGAPEVRGVYVGGLSESVPKRMLPGVAAAVLSSSGYLLFAVENMLFAQKFDARSLEPIGERIRVADSVATDRTFGPPGVAVSTSPAGPIVYRARPPGDDHQLVWYDRSGNEVARLGPPSVAGQSPSLSPDGRQIAVSRLVDANRDIWLLDLERNVFSRFTFDPAPDGSPLWTSDGRRIIFSSNRSGILSIYQKDVAGGDEEPLLVTEQNINTGDISRDGRVMFLSRADPKTLRDLWAKRLGSAEAAFPVVRTPAQDLNGQFAPNGAWLAYQSNESGRYEVSLRMFGRTGPVVQVSTNGGTQPRWDGDGRELFYVGLDRQLMVVPVAFSRDAQAVKVGIPSPLFATRIGGASTVQSEYLASKDGKRFLLDSPIRDVSPPISVILNWHPPS